MNYNNQYNSWTNGTLISGVVAATTGTPFPVKGMKSFSFSVDSNGGSFTAIIQGNLSDSQQNWFNLFSTGTSSTTASVLYNISTPLNAVRGVISTISAGTGTIWYSATSI